MTIKNRLDLIIRQLGYSGREFEKQTGLANGTYSSIGDGVGADKLQKILFTFPQISAEWLLTGKGEAFNSSVPTENSSNVLVYLEIIKSQQETIQELVRKLGNNVNTGRNVQNTGRKTG